jgi:RNA polymerase sigma factor (sigma-70 family)
MNPPTLAFENSLALHRYVESICCWMRDAIAMTRDSAGYAAAESIHSTTTRIQSGDEEAFTWFYEQYCDRLFRYLLVLSRGDEILSRELLQTTMLKVARAMRPFATESDLWRWLTAVARNTFIDARRKGARGPRLLPLMADEPRHLPIASNTDTEELWSTALEHALAGLDPDESALVEAVYFDGGSHRSLAAKQDTTPKAVESKLARVRQKLRASILKYLHDDNR